MKSHVPGLLLVALLASCYSGPIEPSEPLQVPDPPILALVVAPDAATIAVGDSLQMTARLRAPREWRIVSSDWAVSDSTIAEVSSIGLVRARRTGAVGVRARVLFDHGGGLGTGSGMATVCVK